MGDSFLRHVTAQNAAAWRDEIFAAVRSRADWTLEREADLERVRLWIREAVNPGSDVAQIYRKLGPELDLEADIVECLPAFERTPCFGPLEAGYSLRMLWRVLMRRYAIAEARKVGRRLGKVEGLGWRRWRGLGYLYPRLLVGVLLGFFTLGASSGVTDGIQALRFHTWWPVPVACVTLVSLLAFADVERRVGRGKIAARACRIVGFGVLYAALLAWSLYGGAAALGLTRCHFWPVPVMWGSVALVLGFVFQLFWQDRSIGEPL